MIKFKKYLVQKLDYMVDVTLIYFSSYYWYDMIFFMEKKYHQWYTILILKEIKLYSPLNSHILKNYEVLFCLTDFLLLIMKYNFWYDMIIL